MLVSFYASLAITSSIFEVVGMKSLTTMEWWGVNNAESFLTEFMRRYNLMNRVEGALTDTQVRDILYIELQKSF